LSGTPEIPCTLSLLLPHSRPSPRTANPPPPLALFPLGRLAYGKRQELIRGGDGGASVRRSPYFCMARGAAPAVGGSGEVLTRRGRRWAPPASPPPAGDRWLQRAPPPPAASGNQGGPVRDGHCQLRCGTAGRRVRQRQTSILAAKKMLLYRGAPVGPGAPGGGLARAGSVPQAFGIRLSTMSPRYLQSNSSSHTRPFSAIAELLDNAVDPDVSARTVFIDVEVVKNKPCLTFTDDGCGMTPHKLHRMLSFGFTDKVIKKSQCPIGVFGNGFKSGSMRLGKDALVFTKNGGTLTVGLLSQTYLDLEAILNYSIFNSEKDLLSQFDAIPGKKGTRVLIWNVRRNKDGKSELDFDTDQYDILVSDFDAEEKEIGGVPSKLPETEYSLRAFCSVLYMKPRMKIFLRQKKVTTQMIAKSLADVEHDVYKSPSTNKQVKITFGFSCKYHNQFGVMMYHNNRLIKAFEKVGCQLKPTCGEGVGVIGVIECNFLKPAYNKQDFEYTKEYRSTMSALAQKLNAYWKEKTSQENFENLPTSRPVPSIPDQTWVQCDECLKWRKLPGKVDPSTLPARWFCYYNPHPKYRRCSVPEEQERTEDLYLSKAKQQLSIHETVEKKQPPMEGDKHQVLSNPPKITTTPEMAELNDKMIGYEQINSPSLLPSGGEENKSPLQLKSLDSSVFQFSR
ncbi:hypothetical protein U0070_017437, partial [Myodes glareolus]